MTDPQVQHLAAAKRQLRDTLRARRNTLSATDQSRAAGKICERLLGLPAWTDAGRVALYLANDGEPGTEALIDAAREAGKQVFLPRIQSAAMAFARWDAGTRLSVNRFGIAEPNSDAETLAAAELDLICLPLVGFDRRANRLGMGGGFYDRALDHAHSVTLVGTQCRSTQTYRPNPGTGLSIM